MIEKLAEIEKTHDELTARLADPAVLAQPQQVREVSKALSDLEPVRARLLELLPEFQAQTHHTVSTAFGGSMGSAPDTIPNRLARGLIQRKTGSFGVIVPDVANPFFTLIVRGVERR